MSFVLTTRFFKTGLGTMAQTMIHTAVDASPLPKNIKRGIKNCPWCNRRAKALDRFTKAKP